MSGGGEGIRLFSFFFSFTFAEVVVRLRCLFGWRDREGKKFLFFVFFCFAEFVGERRSAQVGAGGLSGGAGWHRVAQWSAGVRRDALGSDLFGALV